MTATIIHFPTHHVVGRITVLRDESRAVSANDQKLWAVQHAMDALRAQEKLLLARYRRAMKRADPVGFAAEEGN